MHEYLANAIKSRLNELKTLTNPKQITDKLKEIINIIGQTGIYDDFNEPEIKILFDMLQSSNLTILEHAMRTLAAINHSILFEFNKLLREHEDWLIRLLFYQIELFFGEAETITLLEQIFDKEDHRIRWHIVNYIVTLENEKRYELDPFFAELLRNKKQPINNLMARFYFALINPSTYLKKILDFAETSYYKTEQEIDILEIIGLNLWKTKSEIAVDTLMNLYKFYRSLELTSKHFIFFIDGYLELFKQFPTRCISVFSEFAFDHQKEIAEALMKLEFEKKYIRELAQIDDLNKEIKNILEKAFESEELTENFSFKQDSEIIL